MGDVSGGEPVEGVDANVLLPAADGRQMFVEIDGCAAVGAAHLDHVALRACDIVEAMNEEGELARSEGVVVAVVEVAA